MKDVPIALWILAGLVVLAGVAGFVIFMRARGAKKYKMSFFKSIPFCLLFVGAVFFVSITILMHIVPKMAAVNYQIAQSTSILTVIAATALNIRRSSIPFGLLYTLAQALTAYSFILIFLGFTALKKIDD